MRYHVSLKSVEKSLYSLKSIEIIALKKITLYFSDDLILELYA